MRKKGKGLSDFLKDPIGHVKEAFQPIPTKLNNISMKTIEEFGNYPVQSMFVMRTPLSNNLTGALNIVSSGEFNRLQKNANIDQLYHVALVGSFNNTNIIIEKNEVVNIAPFKKSDVTNNTEILRIKLSSNPSLIQLIANTLNFMGPQNFYDYDALGATNRGRNNCQDFVNAVLESNNLLTPDVYKFFYQDISPITNELQNHVPIAVKAVTQTGSIVSRLIGKGKRNTKIPTQFIHFVEKNGFRFL
ncbi:MAG: hypothetical protein ABWZ79_05960 [Pedobacter agri]